ncbi:MULTISPECIES: helix-turn-helix transcriptional regulator [Pseudomonas]|uniref:Helix-turn-helix transcriptional regulator n=1 Tax=Pseudomonas gingeri TaxID=117681 RepID=A0A7Y7WPA4_9PSED|nr:MULTISPECIES: helix-turn-helix transcriptional regulator [Pseudomonas]MBV6750267.1 helix-turn-helix domain-containing protein [Pseudomonas chlororaphis]MPQ68899.1 helix-turn-helix domain-containing protein [Pseudomonas sp. MWU12-2323]NWB84862.1 helix-turn-helix transcriptional regulator [Pseudomonas gingeri]RBH54654.1 XRE family transcriptional regulator [Pseudomonas sp. MWU13-2860]
MTVRSYSPASLDALQVMGHVIRLKRKERGLTVQALADKAGVSRGTVQRIEHGDPRCEIGVVFELATLLGITLFSDTTPLPHLNTYLDAKIAVLPKRIRTPTKKVSNDF